MLHNKLTDRPEVLLAYTYERVEHINTEVVVEVSVFDILHFLGYATAVC